MRMVCYEKWEISVNLAIMIFDSCADKKFRVFVFINNLIFIRGF